MIDHRMIREMSDAFGPPGFESPVGDVVRRYMDGFDVTTDPMNNLYIPHPANQGGRMVIQLDAHLDEVALMVQSVQPNGTLSVVPLGGFVVTSLPSQLFLIRNSSGRLIRGIIASKPPHFRSARDKTDQAPAMDELVLDVGSTSRLETLEDFGIAPGDPAVPLVASDIDPATGLLFGKAFDNRLGCVAVMEVLRRLKHEELPFDLVAGLAAQEEVGMRGASVTAQRIRPDYALVFEGSPADDLYFDEATRQCALKGGVQIRHFDASYISHPKFIDLAEELARAHSIRTQHAVRRGGSTNAGTISLTGKAVPCLVLGIPSRFIHTHYNHAALEDLESCVRLAVEVLKHFKEEHLV